MGNSRAMLSLLVLVVSLGVSLSGAEVVSAPMHGEHEIVAVEDVHAPGETITIKLTPAVERKKADVRLLVDRFRALPLLAGTSLAAVSRDLMVLTPSSRHNMEQLKQLLLQQPEVYELEIGENTYRREGDKPYDKLRTDVLSEAMASKRSSMQDKIKARLRLLMEGRKSGKREKSEVVGAANGDGPDVAKEQQEAARRAHKRAAKRAKRNAKRRALKREGAAGGPGDEGGAGEGESTEL